MNRPSQDALAAPGRLDSLARTDLGADPDPTFDRIAEMVRTLLKVPVALVSLVGPDRQVFPGACGLADPWQQVRQTPLSHSLCQFVVTGAERLVIVDARTDPRARGNLALDDLGVVGYAGIPLTDVNGQVLGSLCAIDHRPREWTAAELDLLADLAASCSDSLRLRISHHQTETAFTRSRLLLRASTALARTSTLDEVVHEVDALVTGVLDPAYVGFSLLQNDGLLRLASGRQLPARIAARWSRFDRTWTTPTALAVRTGEAVLLADRAAVKALTPDAVATFDEMGWQSAASVPLLGKDGTVGALTFCWKQPNALDPGEQAVLTALGGYVGQTVDRIRLLEDRRTAAATMQKALLTELPRHEHLRMAARYLPAHHEDQVGGDWYDAILLDGGRLALVIGDLAGHSITAAAAMSQYRSMLRTLLIDRHEPPSALLRRLEHISRTLGQHGIATVLLAYLDPAPGGGHTLTWANAGHPPPTLVLPGGAVILLEGRDPLLGAGRHISRRNHDRHLPGGSTLLLHTDGLIETRTATVDDGLAEVHELLKQHVGAGPDELADLFLDRSRAAASEDDVAILIVTTPS